MKLREAQYSALGTRYSAVPALPVQLQHLVRPNLAGFDPPLGEFFAGGVDVDAAGPPLAVDPA